MSALAKKKIDSNFFFSTLLFVSTQTQTYLLGIYNIHWRCITDTTTLIVCKGRLKYT